MNNKELELEAEKLFPVNNTGSMFMANREQINNSYKQEGFIVGATSTYVEKQKLEFAIEQLNKLDSSLQAKIETLKNMADKSDDFDNAEYFTIKIAGIKLTKEEIRRDIKELQQQLSEL
jgi:hypothetical protein